MDCINLMEKFGHKYRISWDPAYDPKGRPRDSLDPWYMQVPCKYGCIYPHGGEFLAVEMDHHNQIAKRVVALPGCELVQDGDTEKTSLFDVDQFDVVAQIVKPRCKRQVSEAERQRLATMGAKHGFQKQLPERFSDAPTHSDATA